MTINTNIDDIASRQSKEVAALLGEAAGRCKTEAEFRKDVARALEEAAVEAGVRIILGDEYSVARGRVDSVYNRLILEYKCPGVLRDSNTSRGNAQVIQQVKTYILEVARLEKRESHRLAGVATDGHFFIFIRMVGDG